MLSQDLTDLPIEVFGGYCPAIAPSVLPPGASPLTQDCYFPEGAVATRGGLLAVFGPGNGIPANATINGLKTYLTPTIDRRLMVWDSAGNLYKESPDGTLTLLFARSQGATTLYQASTLFGREYSAYYAYADPLLGLDIPRQYDDTNWDRVSQVGPGASPVANDESSTAFVIAAPAAGLSQPSSAGVPMSEIGFTVTATGFTNPVLAALKEGDNISVTSATVPAYNGTYPILSINRGAGTIQFQVPTSGLAAVADGAITYSLFTVTLTPATTPFTVGQLVTIAGAGVAGYDGTWVVRFNDPGTAFFIVGGAATTVLGASGGGTVGNGGSIPAGRHGVSVAFITRQGFITQAAIPNYYNAGGSSRATLTQIPIGPPNIIARLLLFTPVITPPAMTGTFYSIPNGNPFIFSSAMLVPDNVTTTWTVDFTDVILIANFQAQYLFTQLELGECASVNGYNSRLAWCGERNKVSNFNNLTFDGGFQNQAVGALGILNVPLGWTPDPLLYLFASSALLAGFTVDWGDAFFFQGAAGPNAVRGKITQTAYKDYLDVPIIAQNTSYSVRCRAMSNSLANSALHINLQSTSQAFTTAGLVVNQANLPADGKFHEFIFPLTNAPLATVPADLLLQVYMVSSNAADDIIVDSIEVFPTLQPYNFSTARISHSFNPESYDATTGAVQIRPNDGQMLHASFPIRGNLYFGKDHYLCYVTDDGVNEPASWGVNEVSATIGICGPNAVDWTEEWAVFAERSGLYIFWGSDPVKITPEIQADASGTGKITWNSINWDKSQSIWVRIDRVNKQILVGAPVGKNADGIEYSLPNVVFMLDYKWLEGAQDIASSEMVTYSAFTGKVLAHGRGRRWMIWNIAAASMTYAERADGTVQPFFGNSAKNGKVYEQLQSQLSDDGAAINSFYATYYSPSHVEEQIVQLGAHQKMLGYLKWRTAGSGILSISITTTRRTTNLRGYILSTTPLGDGERGMEIAGERFSITVGTNAVGSWFQLEQLIPCMKKHPTMVVRGANA